MQTVKQSDVTTIINYNVHKHSNTASCKRFKVKVAAIAPNIMLIRVDF